MSLATHSGGLKRLIPRAQSVLDRSDVSRHRCTMQGGNETPVEVGRMSSTNWEIVFRVCVARDVSRLGSFAREICLWCTVFGIRVLLLLPLLPFFYIFHVFHFFPCFLFSVFHCFIS